jgi:DNA-binding LacI/PurR family transcriptional regulator
MLEFARRVGLSTATVSRAFHEPEKLRPATRERILALANELHYFPNPSGRALVTGRHDILGLIWPMEVEGSGAQFSHRILASLAQVLAANDLDLLICPVDRREPGTLDHARRTLLRSRCDAWILLYPRHHDELIDALQNVRKPVVCLMGEIEECPTWKCVRLNQRRWIEDALRRLKESGCRRVLLFGTRIGEPDHEERRAVFAELAPKYFSKRSAILPDWPPDIAKLREILSEQSVDAIIGVDDHAALSALDTCREMGIAVPDKIRVVGIDDTASASFSTPALSSYRQPLDEMMRCAVDLAMGKRARSVRFEAVFVPRASLPSVTDNPIPRECHSPGATYAAERFG